MIATQAGIELESMRFHEASETYRFGFDQDTTPPSMAVVAALSEATDTEPTKLKALNSIVDGDALNTLLDVRTTGTGDVHVTWTQENHTVTVHSHGMVGVAPTESEHREDRNEELHQ